LRDVLDGAKRLELRPGCRPGWLVGLGRWFARLEVSWRVSAQCSLTCPVGWVGWRRLARAQPVVISAVASGRVCFASVWVDGEYTAAQGPTLHPMSDDDAQKLHALRAITAGFDTHDLDRIMVHFTDDCVFELPHGPEAVGRRVVGQKAVRAAFADRFAGIPDVRYTDDSHFVAGDRGGRVAADRHDH
jgi:hypothetical protein